MASKAFPVGRFLVDAAAAQDEFALKGLLIGFMRGLTVDDANYFASADGALAGFAGYVSDRVFFVVHTLGF